MRDYDKELLNSTRDQHNKPDWTSLFSLAAIAAMVAMLAWHVIFRMV